MLEIVAALGAAVGLGCAYHWFVVRRLRQSVGEQLGAFNLLCSQFDKHQHPHGHSNLRDDIASLAMGLQRQLAFWDALSKRLDEHEHDDRYLAVGAVPAVGEHDHDGRYDLLGHSHEEAQQLAPTKPHRHLWEKRSEENTGAGVIGIYRCLHDATHLERRRGDEVTDDAA